MPFPNPATQFKPGQSGNLLGKPKGTKHLSTWIQDLLNDEEFISDNIDGQEYKGAPIKAIIKVAIKKSIDGDNKWAEWLGKHGYGIKTETDITTKGETLNTAPDPLLASAFANYLKEKQ